MDLSFTLTCVGGQTWGLSNCPLGWPVPQGVLIFPEASWLFLPHLRSDLACLDMGGAETAVYFSSRLVGNLMLKDKLPKLKQ